MLVGGKILSKKLIDVMSSDAFDSFFQASS